MTDAATALRSNLYALREFISRVTIGAGVENAHRDLDEVMMAVGEVGTAYAVESDRPGADDLPNTPIEHQDIGLREAAPCLRNGIWRELITLREAMAVEYGVRNLGNITGTGLAVRVKGAVSGGWDARTFRGWACMLLGISASEAQATTIAKLAGAVADLVPLTTATASDDPPAHGGKPTGPGWWWVRGVSGWQPVEVFEFSGGLRMSSASSCSVVALDEREWDGPCVRGVPQLTEADLAPVAAEIVHQWNLSEHQGGDTATARDLVLRDLKPLLATPQCGRRPDDWAKVLLALGLVDNASPAAARAEIQRRACESAHVRDALAGVINEHGGECEPGKVSLSMAWDMFEAEVLPGRVDGSALPAGSAMLAELWGALNVTPGPSSGWREVVDQVSLKTVGHARALAALDSAGRFMRNEARTIDWLAALDVEMPKVREGLAQKAEVWHRAAAKILGAS